MPRSTDRFLVAVPLAAVLILVAVWLGVVTNSGDGAKTLVVYCAHDREYAQQVLENSQASRDVVQDFCPLAESLEWDLGQQYLKERGNKAFISDASPVPFVVNNNGTLSRNTAEVFFANLVETEKSGPLEDEIFVLELGIGVGLFARFFLDCFRDICRKHKKDYYDRLCYIAADRSPRMLMDVLRHGVLGDHMVGRIAQKISLAVRRLWLQDRQGAETGPSREAEEKTQHRFGNLCHDWRMYPARSLRRRAWLAGYRVYPVYRRPAVLSHHQ